MGHSRIVPYLDVTPIDDNRIHPESIGVNRNRDLKKFRCYPPTHYEKLLLILCTSFEYFLTPYNSRLEIL